MAFEKEVQNFTAEGTDLPESKLSTGFLPGEKPPANWFNNLIYRLTQATRELQEKVAEKEYVDTTIAEKLDEFSENIGENLKDLAVKTITASEDNIVDFNNLTDVGIYIIKNANETTSLNNPRPGGISFLFVGNYNGIVYQGASIIPGFNTATYYRCYVPINSAWENWKTANQEVGLSIPTAGWSSTAPYTRSIAASIALASDTNITIIPQWSSTLETRKAQQEAWNCVSMIETYDGGITVTCDDEIPTTAIPIRIVIQR